MIVMRQKLLEKTTRKKMTGRTMSDLMSSPWRYLSDDPGDVTWVGRGGIQWKGEMHHTFLKWEPSYMYDASMMITYD